MNTKLDTTADKVAWIQRYLDTFAAPGKAPDEAGQGASAPGA